MIRFQIGIDFCLFRPRRRDQILTENDHMSVQLHLKYNEIDYSTSMMFCDSPDLEFKKENTTYHNLKKPKK